MWPVDAESLRETQHGLAAARPRPWQAEPAGARISGCWACFPRGLSGRGGTHDPAWAASVVLVGGRVVDRSVVEGYAGAPYTPGLLALRLGPLLEKVVRSLAAPPDVLLLDATGRDHPRRAGLALHLGAELDVPTVGVTHRPLLAEGEWPADVRGAVAPLRIGREEVARWVRTQPGTRPLVVHPGWRVDLDQAVAVVMAATASRRTPEPLRRARQLAREARVDQPHASPKLSPWPPTE